MTFGFAPCIYSSRGVKVFRAVSGKKEAQEALPDWVAALWRCR
jgi:hypothetical protein